MSLTRYILVALFSVGLCGVGLTYGTQHLSQQVEREAFAVGVNSLDLAHLENASKALARLFVTCDVVFGNNLTYLRQDADLQVKDLEAELRGLEQSTLVSDSKAQLSSIFDNLNKLRAQLKRTEDAGKQDDLKQLTQFDTLSKTLLKHMRTLTSTAKEASATAEKSLEQRRETNAEVALCASVVYVVFLLIFAWMSARFIFSPVRDLTRLAKGALRAQDRQLKSVRGPTEFIELSHEIKRFVAGLEDAVAQRTQALELKSNDLLREVQERRTAQNRLESALERLKEAQASLIKVERLKALGEMVSGVAHDFNNLLTPIMSYSSLLRECRSLPESEQIEYLQLIETATQDAASLIRRMRTFYKPENDVIPKATFEIELLVHAAVQLARPRWLSTEGGTARQLELVLDLKPLSTFYGFESELRQALINLLFNAADAVDTDGQITIQTYESETDVCIIVKDNGSGMSPDILDKCQEPFFSTKKERGTGLGLAMVFGTATRHGGTLEIQSAVGQGSSFCLKLPRNEPTHLPDEPKSLSMLDFSQRLKVLVVDDDPLIRRMLGQVFVLEDHQLLTAENTDQADALWQLEQFDLVISDLDMPGAKGDVILAKYKKHTPSVITVLFSGRTEAVNDANRSSIDLILAKPMSSTEVFEQIKAKFG
jgi:signal transduction histidine kinase/CheY-like chemotaxis protein